MEGEEEGMFSRGYSSEIVLLKFIEQVAPCQALC